MNASMTSLPSAPAEAARLRAPAFSVADGSAFSRTLLRVKKGKWVYRNFHVVTKGWHWRIMSACGDAHFAKSLADARKQIDAWYAEGSVES